MSPVNFSNVLQHLEVIERMHRSNVLTSKNAEDVKQCDALADEYKAARELLATQKLETRT